MYNINLISPQAFTESANNQLYFQSWKTDVVTPIKYFHFVGQPTPAATVFDVIIENHFATEPAGKYSIFSVKAKVVDFSGDNDNLKVTAGDMTENQNGLTLTPGNLTQPVTLSLQNLSLTTPGSFTAEIDFLVSGVRADSGLTDLYLSRFRIPIELKIMSNNSVSANVDKIVLSHIKTELPLPPQPFEILSGVDFHIFVPEYFELSGGNLVQVESSNSKNKYFGHGRQTVNIAVKQDFDFFPNEVYIDHIGIQLIESFFEPKWQTELVAYLLDDHEINSEKEALEFFSIKNVRDAAQQSLEISSSEDYIVTAPFFLQVSPLNGTSFNTHIVKPISANNLVAGDYEGIIVFESVNATLEVPVSLRVVESIDPSFYENQLNFTDDNEDFTNLYSNNLDFRASLELAITSYDFKGFPKLTSNPFKLAFYNSKVAIHIGEIIARRFNKINSLSDVGYNHYDLEIEQPQLFEIIKYAKPCILDIQLDIERRKELTIFKTKTVKDIHYIKGRKPKLFSNDYGILNYDPVPIRVTKKSQMIFNFVRKLLDHDIIIKRNNVTYKTVTHSPGSNFLFGMRMFFTDFNPGDIIDIKLVKNEEEYFVQQYFVFPDQNNSNHLAYQSEYNVLETFECTGAFSFNSGYENITSITYAKLVEYMENLDSSKEQTLTINTGWILKSNQVIVDAISRAKRVWFVNKGKEMSLTPLTKKLVNEDSEEELYQYDMEFKINLKNDSEVYTS